MSHARLRALLGLCVAVAVCLSACSTDYSRSYNRALDTFASGEYAEAAEAFEAIGEFEDAPLRCQYCLGRDAEAGARYDEALFAYEAAITIDDAEARLYNLRGQIYNRAIALKQEGDYQSAIDLFTLLGDYLSSADQAVECKTYLRDAEYDQADALESSGDLQGAYDLFSSLSSYRDAAQRAEDLAAQLGIE